MIRRLDHHRQLAWYRALYWRTNLKEFKANHPLSTDVLQPRLPLLRFLRRWLYHQIHHPARDRLRTAMRAEIHGGQREDQSKVPGTAGTDDEQPSSREINEMRRRVRRRILCARWNCDERGRMCKLVVYIMLCAWKWGLVCVCMLY